MHNQNETQQHGESRHVERTFLYTYVPNSGADSFFYSAGRCFYCTHVQLVRDTTISLIQSFLSGSFLRCHTIRHYVLTFFYISRYISKWLCYNLANFSSTKRCMVDWNTTLRCLERNACFLNSVDAPVKSLKLCDCSKLTVDCTLYPPGRFDLT